MCIYASAAYQISTSPVLRQIKTLHLQNCNPMMLKSQPYSNREGTQPSVAAVLWERLALPEQLDSVRKQFALVSVVSQP